jgi:hypothetical protein
VLNKDSAFEASSADAALRRDQAAISDYELPRWRTFAAATTMQTIRMPSAM